MDRAEFVAKCGELLAIAKPHLVKCEYFTRYEEEFVQVTCENGHKYEINITANSLAAIAYQIFNEMRFK